VQIDKVLDFGTYFLFVDSSDGGSYRVAYDTQEAPELAQLCKAYKTLGRINQLTWDGKTDMVNAECGGGATGNDQGFRMDLGERSRVRLTHRTPDGTPVVHLRKTCDDPKSEIACSDTGYEEAEATLTQVLDKGVYTVFADTQGDDPGPTSELKFESTSAQGNGVPGDSCMQAITLTPGTEAQGDTFEAHADVRATCTDGLSPDIFYRIDVPKRMHLTVSFARHDGRHALALYKSCSDKPVSVDCADQIDRIVPSGTYYVGVHGHTEHAFGQYSIVAQLEDVAAREAACKSAVHLKPGTATKGSTQGGAALFSSNCFTGTGGSTPDKVYSFTLQKEQKVTFHLSTKGYAGLLSIRRNCLDSGPGGGELNCSRDLTNAHETVLEQILPAGSYYVVSSGSFAGPGGDFTLRYDTQEP
jgi:hypothetical protein